MPHVHVVALATPLPESDDDFDYEILGVATHKAVVVDLITRYLFRLNQIEPGEEFYGHFRVDEYNTDATPVFYPSNAYPILPREFTYHHDIVPGVLVTTTRPR